MTVDLEVFASASLAAAAAARRFVAAAQDAIRTRGEFVVALSGGSTARTLYAQLAAEPHGASVNWSCVQILWGDERCVPADHPASNFRMARETLLDVVSVPEANVHRIRGEDDPAAAAVAYERVVRSVLRTPTGPPRDAPGARFDLILLGLGDDGHTASLFPDTATLHDRPCWVRAAYVPAVSMWRITLTPIIINAAAEVAFLVLGDAKADVLRRVLEGPRRPRELPAQLIAPVAGRVRWFVDAPAAAALHNTPGG
jgi:6-phosphogluconolactonase